MSQGEKFIPVRKKESKHEKCLLFRLDNIFCSQDFQIYVSAFLPLLAIVKEK